MEAALEQLLDSEEHRQQAIELLHARDDTTLWREAVERVPTTMERFRDEPCTRFEPGWWELLEAAPPGVLPHLDRLLVRARRVTRLPPARELVLDTCTLVDPPRGCERLLLAGCAVEAPLPPCPSLELHWPQGPFELEPGSGRVRITGALERPTELSLDCEHLVLHWAHALKGLRTTGSLVAVDCDALAEVSAGGPITLLRAGALEDRFAAESEPFPRRRVLQALHASLGTDWPLFVPHGPRLLDAGAQWVADWTDTDALLLAKQGPWEDMLAAFRAWPQAPRAAAESYLGAFGRSRPRAERFLNRVFHNPWGLNERTFGRSGLEALSWLVEHPRCPERDLVRQVAERVSRATPHPSGRSHEGNPPEGAG